MSFTIAFSLWTEKDRDELIKALPEVAWGGKLVEKFECAYSDILQLASGPQFGCRFTLPITDFSLEEDDLLSINYAIATAASFNFDIAIFKRGVEMSRIPRHVYFRIDEESHEEIVAFGVCCDRPNFRFCEDN